MARAFILIHGAWHDHHCWQSLVSLLEAAGHPVRAIDLPGAGAAAPRPACYDAPGDDRSGMTREPSPNAGVTQAQRTEAVIAEVRAMAANTGERPLLVGHSLGGLTVSAVAETVPQEIGAAVYLTAMMLPPGMASIEVGAHPASAGSLTGSLILGDARLIGARRLDPRATDPAYRERVRQTFYGDLTDAAFHAALAHLHPDEPAAVTLEPSPVTAGRFGTVPRHYIECLRDRAITIAMQRELVRLVDDAVGGRTRVHTLDCSHSPFHSQPQALAALLLHIAQD